MKTLSKSQNSIRISHITPAFFVFVSAVLFLGAFSLNVSAEEPDAEQIATLGSDDKNSKKEKNNEKPTITNEEGSITYSLDDGSMEGPYGDGVYTQ